MWRKILRSHENFVSIPYKNIDFFISKEFVLSTNSCFADNSFVSENKIYSLDDKICYFFLDSIVKLFSQKSCGLCDDFIQSKIKTSIVIKGKNNFEIITSADCRVLELTQDDFSKNKSILVDYFLFYGITEICFYEGRLGLVLNPNIFFEKIKNKMGVNTIKND